MTGDRRWHLIGAALGLSLALLPVVVDGRVAAGPDGLGAEVRMEAGPIGELATAPTGTFLTGTDIRPGTRVAGRLRVRNQTGATLAVTGRSETSTSDLDRALHVRVQAGATTVADGSLADLAEGSRPWNVASGEETDLTFEVWLEAGATGYQGAFVEVDLHLDVTTAEAPNP